MIQRVRWTIYTVHAPPPLLLPMRTFMYLRANQPVTVPQLPNLSPSKVTWTPGGGGVVSGGRKRKRWRSGPAWWGNFLLLYPLNFRPSRGFLILLCTYCMYSTSTPGVHRQWYGSGSANGSAFVTTPGLKFTKVVLESWKRSKHFYIFSLKFQVKLKI